MSENDAEIQVTVDLPEVNEDTPEEIAAPVTVVTPPADTSSDVAVEAAIDHEGRLVRLEDAQNAILSRLEEIALAVTVTTDATAEMIAEVEEVREEVAEVAEEAQAEPDDDEEPERHHPFYKPRRIFGKAD